MFKIESYITPILLSYVDKYVKDFKPADAQVSLWGGGVALHNLVLKADVLQQEVSLPFTLVSGRIHELLIQVPWTKIMSEPIIVTIDTIECILSLHPPPDENPSSELTRSPVVEAPPGYMRALVRRVVSNIGVRVHHLIVKYVQDDIVLSLNVKHLAVDSADNNWEPAFADISVDDPALRRLVRLDDLTLCLDRADADGKIRFYQEPLLYRCQLDFRVLTRLVSVTRRRARNVSVRMRADRLAGGASGEQLALLLRLLGERPVPPPPSTTFHTAQPPAPSSSTASLEGVRSESWSEWAWSWLPAWESTGSDEAIAPASQAPFTFAAYFDHVSFTFKVMETDAGGRRRARAVLELIAMHAAVKSNICTPVTLRVRAGARVLTLQPYGKCVCGHFRASSPNDEPSVYLTNIDNTEEPWTWPEGDNDQEVETAIAADEQFRASPEISETTDNASEDSEQTQRSHHNENGDELWTKMVPVIFFEYCHDRAPPSTFVDPYDNPPLDFQYSDWAEDSSVVVRVRPLQIEVCGGLLHRLAAATDFVTHLQPYHHQPELTLRTLTVEECEALSDNLPQRSCNVEIRGLRLRIFPWYHGTQRSAVPLLLDVELPLTEATIVRPLYPYRVCSAACQMPEDEGVIWSGARMHVTLSVSGAQAGVRVPTAPLRTVARLNLRLAAHSLLHPYLFEDLSTVRNSFTLNIREASVCGSWARLMAAREVLYSMTNARLAPVLAHSTLAHDALHDEELVAVDLTLEELTVRGYVTRGLRTYIGSLHAARAIALHAPKSGDLKQAWLFSGPEAPTTSLYMRIALQWRAESEAGVKEGGNAGVEFAGVWIEPSAISLDPLLVAAFSYAPRYSAATAEPQPQSGGPKTISSSQYFMLRRTTPPSSSGRGGSRTGSGAEVHARPRSAASSSERSEHRQPQQQVRAQSHSQAHGHHNAFKKHLSWLWNGESAVRVHKRLRRALACCELGLVQVYVPGQSAAASGHACLRDSVERHAVRRAVLVLSLGHLSMHSNTMVKHLWNEIRHDGPTFFSTKSEALVESFPWRLRIADVSCYTLEPRPATATRSMLRDARTVAPRDVLGLLTTTITLSVVTKSLSVQAPPTSHRTRYPVHDEKIKYFTSGVDFKPSTLKEFIRGPSKNKRSSPEGQVKTSPEPIVTPTAALQAAGPVVSLGVHIHADTPPITLRFDNEQVGVIADALHCFSHLMALLKRPPFSAHAFSHTRPVLPPGSTVPPSKILIRSVSEMEEPETRSDETLSENRSELIPIYEASALSLSQTKTFVWVQWVISRATLAVSAERARLTAEADDVIATVDLQPHYSQVKLKIASASLRHYRRTESEEWEAGALGGRVLEAREPVDAKEDNHFLALTITQAQISNLPASWKEELHPKLLEQKSLDSMWEIYATVAPLEAVLQASVVRHAADVLRLLLQRVDSTCYTQALGAPGYPVYPYAPPDPSSIENTWQPPFFYLAAGGLRLLLISEENKDSAEDDTLMLNIGKITVNPHPDNPICRRAVSSSVEGGVWGAGGVVPEGRQYEALARAVALRSARFHQLVRQEVSEAEIMKGTGGENPALKWSQPVISPVITPILHPVELECVLAPAAVNGNVMVSGPALEFNLASDCALELSLHQLSLAVTLAANMKAAFSPRRDTVEMEELETCPYTPNEAELSQEDAGVPPLHSYSPRLIRSESLRTEAAHSTADSGVESTASHSATKPSFNDELDGPVKKNVSIAFEEHIKNPWDYLEVFVTMGMIEASLYVVDNGSVMLAPLRVQEPELIDHVPLPSSPLPAANVTATAANTTTVPVDQPRLNVVFEGNKEMKKEVVHESATAGSSSVADNIRLTDIDKSQHDLMNALPRAKRIEGNLQLIQFTFQQPNLYYWQKETQKTLQVSLFDVGVALGGGTNQRVLLSTERGALDPLTDIAPALATLKLTLPASGAAGTGIPNARGSLHLDIERPVLLDVCTDRLVRLHTVLELLKKQLNRDGTEAEEDVKESAVNRVLKYMNRQGLESISLFTGQMGARGVAGTIGWSGAKMFINAAARPDRLSARVLLHALLASVGAPHDCRRPLLLPATIGGTMEATWDGWRRSDNSSRRKAGVRCALHADALTFDFRPADLAALDALQDALLCLQQLKQKSTTDNTTSCQAPTTTVTMRTNSSLEDLSDHYYKDDLRSGAFKLVQGGQVPMAYQVRAADGVLTWRYPHPRALTRLLVFPIPGLDEEVECVLELFESTLLRWEPHIYFHLPTSEPREIKLDLAIPDLVFAMMWRVRVCPDVELEQTPFLFDVKSFLSQPNLGTEAGPSGVGDIDMGTRTGGVSEAGSTVGGYKDGCGVKNSKGSVSAEQLGSTLRVDSYFAPRLLPAARFALRLASLTLYLHNDLPRLQTEKSGSLEGLYVSRPLRRGHRVLALAVRDVNAHVTHGFLAHRCLLSAYFSSDIMECTTGTMERFVEEFRVQASLSRASNVGDPWRVRTCADLVCATLHIPRLNTLHSLAEDWRHTYMQHVIKTTIDDEDGSVKGCANADEARHRLRGRVSLWLHNSCASSIRVSQHATDELLPLGPASMHAYRWRSPYETKKLRFSLANPSSDWRWSVSIPFTEGMYRVRLEEAESCAMEASSSSAGVFIYARVSEHGATRTMLLSGRLILANMLRHSLMYKVRARCASSQQWRAVGAGELQPERIGPALLCDASADLVVKVKFGSHDTGWSGDIPIKECPKENVPWLVKVPSSGDVAYVSVWCRITRARSDNRLLAAFWPLYVLRSHLPLDTEVVITTEAMGTSVSSEEGTSMNAAPPGLVQSAPGRGASTHLAAPGTTAARHMLTLQYRNIECPVTREAVPLHYSVTDTSVFDKCAPVLDVDDVLQEINAWLEQASRDARSEWPYSLIRRHWYGTWQPSLLQPRCDVMVRYTAVVAGGGCSLMAQLCPAALLASAAPVPLTLRAHDAAPLCRLEPGHAVSPPSTLLTKPFFLSLDVGRETFVSEPLCVSTYVPGRYGVPPPSHLTLDHATHIAIHCNQKVALLTMYYEIKEDINVLGITSTYVLINKMDTNILVTCIAVSEGIDDDIVLNPKSFKVIPPTNQERGVEGSLGEPLCRAWVWGRWRSGARARTFLCVSLACGAAVPVRLAAPPARRAIALRDENNQSVAVVVTQQQHEGRWQVAVASDPCPQFLVYNYTREQLAIGQALRSNPDNKEPFAVMAAQECAGARWWCTVGPGESTHYSSPVHCARYPPLGNPAAPSTLSTKSTNEAALTFLTFAHASEDERRPLWCTPVVVADGEQMLQLVGGATIKLRVRTTPHSTLLELQDIAQHDISASDIRRRLVGTTSNILQDQRYFKESGELERIDAADNLLELSKCRHRLDPLPSKNELVIKDETKSRMSEASNAISLPSNIEKSQLATKPTNRERSVTVGTSENRPRNSSGSFSTPNTTESNFTSGMERMQTTSVLTVRSKDFDCSDASMVHNNVAVPGAGVNLYSEGAMELVRCEVRGLQARLAAAPDRVPLLALHLDDMRATYRADAHRGCGTVSVSSLQVDNAQYMGGQYDFAVVANSRTPPPIVTHWPPLWGSTTTQPPRISSNDQLALQIDIITDAWTVAEKNFNEVTEVDVRVGPLALYIEDAYVRALATLLRDAWPACERTDQHAHALSVARTMQCPLRLRSLTVHPLDLALTLHTAVRMYIALDQSPLRLGAFWLRDVMTSTERLTHALTVHYLSAALLSAGWVVGGLELVGAPGALAARVSGAGGGVRGVASAAAAALLRSLSAAAGSIARNLDLLAGDPEHAQRAAAARRHPPPSFLAGLTAGLTNFAINILGAVGGLAHHPVVGVCVGEAGGGAALRRGLLGALTKPLSATADLVAYAGHGLLAQTGWDVTPQSRAWSGTENEESGGVEVWRRECVRWAFRLAELPAFAGFRVLLDNAPLLLIVTHKFLVVADPETERIVEMIDLKSCMVQQPLEGHIIEMLVKQRRSSKSPESRTTTDEDNEYQISAAAMARVARYTGAGAASGGGGGGGGGGSGGGSADARILLLRTAPAHAQALHAALVAASQHNCPAHFPLL